MKKWLTIFILLVLILFSGCSTPKPSALDSLPKSMHLEIGETYLFGDFDHYESSNEVVASFDQDGRIHALKNGISELIIYEGSRHVAIQLTVGQGEELPLIIDIIDIGQGDAILIQLPNGEVMMIDCGKARSDSWDKISSKLNNYHITTIDHLIITHNHSDHYDLVPDLISNYDVLAIYGSGSTRTNITYLQIMQAIDAAGLEIYVVEVGDKIIDEVGLVLQVVATQQIENEDNPNISSVVVKLTYLNTSYLFMGDAGFASSRDGENTALNSGIELDSDVLKVGHHGSYEASGEAFLAEVTPAYALITTDQDSTNHPHVNALNRLIAVGATIYQTKDQGTITITSDGEEIAFSFEK